MGLLADDLVAVAVTVRHVAVGGMAAPDRRDAVRAPRPRICGRCRCRPTAAVRRPMWKSIRTSCHLGVRVGRVRIDERPADAPLGIIKPTCRAWILKQWYSKLDQTTGQAQLLR